ncbi:hypothetical protein [Flavobacterium sp.]|uniref:hypothetical protein n=1 Tax=Flavobacterium sp. TaxID=239 RepID=UPI003A92C277
MKDNIPNLNGFPTDNSPSTQLKYDLITSKILSAIKSHQNRTTPSPVSAFGLIGALIQITIALVVMVMAGVIWVLRMVFK